MGEQRVCEAFDCVNPIALTNPTGFCYACSSSLAHSANELEKDLDKVLRLEAEFVAWCVANGHPNPHD